jgi:hypothetical protein
MNKTLYYQNCPVTEEDFSDISGRFRIPYDTVAEVIEQMREDGFPNWASFTGTIRERIGQMVDAISLKPETRPDEADEEPQVDSPTEQTEAIEPLPVSEEDDIVEHAAISLMQAMSETKTGSFIITEDGVCTINKNSPPSLIESYEVVANVLKLRSLAPKMEDKTSWMLGSIIDELENLHGENFEVGQVAETTDKSLNTIWTTVSVYRAFKKKRYKLSFSSHKEAFHQKIPDESKHLILHKAEVFKLGPKPIRHLACIVKTMGDDQVIKNIRSKQQAEDLILAHKSNKVTYLVFDDGWKRISGSASFIPEGKVVIDLKNWTARANNGEPVEIKKSKA